MNTNKNILLIDYGKFYWHNFSLIHTKKNYNKKNLKKYDNI